jgi:hypothetical protein
MTLHTFSLAGRCATLVGYIVVLTVVGSLGYLFCTDVLELPRAPVFVIDATLMVGAFMWLAYRCWRCT